MHNHNGQDRAVGRGGEEENHEEEEEVETALCSLFKHALQGGASEVASGLSSNRHSFGSAWLLLQFIKQGKIRVPVRKLDLSACTLPPRKFFLLLAAFCNSTEELSLGGAESVPEVVGAIAAVPAGLESLELRGRLLNPPLLLRSLGAELEGGGKLRGLSSLRVVMDAEGLYGKGTGEKCASRSREPVSDRMPSSDAVRSSFSNSSLVEDSCVKLKREHARLERLAFSGLSCCTQGIGFVPVLVRRRQFVALRSIELRSCVFSAECFRDLMSALGSGGVKVLEKFDLEGSSVCVPISVNRGGRAGRDVAELEMVDESWVLLSKALVVETLPCLRELNLVMENGGNGALSARSAGLLLSSLRNEKDRPPLLESVGLKLGCVSSSDAVTLLSSVPSTQSQRKFLYPFLKILHLSLRKNEALAFFNGLLRDWEGEGAEGDGGGKRGCLPVAELYLRIVAGGDESAAPLAESIRTGLFQSCLRGLTLTVFDDLQSTPVGIEAKIRLLKALGEGPLPMLSFINLRRQNLDDGDLVMLAASVRYGNLGGLRHLNLGGNLFGRHGIEALMGAVCGGGLRFLEILDLSRTRAGEGMEAVAAALSSDHGFSSLHSLHLPVCRVDDEGMRSLSSAFCSTSNTIPSLTVLDLNLNFISSEGLETFLESLLPQTLPSLQCLLMHGVRCNRHTARNLVSQAQAEGKLQSLTDFVV
uniref:Uncharacterized protein n=1 Tax=Chromera velia CCMP2878 TaxID=1169474 RepID=A0A0K6S8A5_9ALVE|eukprot:Cvel_5448.t1-p1 / transcript=Cvel_5448.t1 / gene=Cvel_5448 / organism=Chromera_velia_CCMP2878 / gene_product=hypothetical protein / transcript_product=hypothetical protein / location=Cvel_scaffold254:71901-76027(+) / protein_length=701 / sequence_SO=supercontig / SO=protein_coding / is_pseudo=false